MYNIKNKLGYFWYQTDNAKFEHKKCVNRLAK